MGPRSRGCVDTSLLSPSLCFKVPRPRLTLHPQFHVASRARAREGAWVRQHLSSGVCATWLTAQRATWRSSCARPLPLVRRREGSTARRWRLLRCGQSNLLSMRPARNAGCQPHRPRPNAVNATAGVGLRNTSRYSIVRSRACPRRSPSWRRSTSLRFSRAGGTLGFIARWKQAPRRGSSR